MASKSPAPPRRGVGLIHSPPLHDLFLRRRDLIDVAEIEPQTAWITADPIAGPFRQIESALATWNELPQHRYLHSVGMPLAGTRRPSSSQMQLLAGLAETFGCSYVSEHLSVGGTPHENAGFLLPPCQTWAGVDNAARNIRELAAGVGRPIAVETGVSYLRPYPGEIPDGSYVAAVAEAADCGILFDVHNIYCNERNGRQRLIDFAAALPADRVWELHVAGGVEIDGYWLDAHNGPIPADLVAAARELVRGLPNITAVILEIFPSYLSDDSDTMVLKTLEDARSIYEAIGKPQGDGILRLLPAVDRPASPPSNDNSVVAWEEKLTRGIRLRLPTTLGADLSLEPAIPLYSTLAHSFRASSLARLLPRTLRLLAMLGSDVETIILRYEAETPAPLFALNEAESFGAWLETTEFASDLSLGLYRYDVALARVPVDNRPIVVHFAGDPRPLFQALTDLTALPDALEAPPWEIEITPDEAGGPRLTALSS